MARDFTGNINETIALVLEGKHQHKTIPSCALLEMYDKRPIFISVDITEDTFELVPQTLLVSSGPRGTYSKSLQGWILKFGEDSKILRTSVETFFDRLANWIPPWAAYRAFRLAT